MRVPTAVKKFFFANDSLAQKRKYGLNKGIFTQAGGL
jgi:hypothetical protein